MRLRQKQKENEKKKNGERLSATHDEKKEKSQEITPKACQSVTPVLNRQAGILSVPYFVACLRHQQRLPIYIIGHVRVIHHVLNGLFEPYM